MIIIHKRKIIFDFDNTITASSDKLIYLANKEYKTNVKFGSWSSYDFTDIFPQMTNPTKYFEMPQFFKNLHFIDKDMKPMLKALKVLGFEIIIATLGSEKNIELKKKWIAENLPFISVDDSHFIVQAHNDKSCVDMSDSIFIDDVIENLNSSNAWHKICFGKVTGYNKHAEDLGYFRASNSLILFMHILGLMAEGEIEG